MKIEYSVLGGDADAHVLNKLQNSKFSLRTLHRIIPLLFQNINFFFFFFYRTYPTQTINAMYIESPTNEFYICVQWMDVLLSK